ncbi:hypothetical protein [Agromyces ramosus]|uniref:Uncharacterized protein n=1 Tax=Agromyces ramosus TaxID=33879 RepID=A0ABU0RDV3_9MICO|nr:hypothetical protein [Agromyces ramosus]MDQ0895927.1 hypothetical protein [Agromyces ramosus]
MSSSEPTTPTDAPARAPFAMIAGDPAAMVCEGDVCFIPGAEG